MLRSRRVWIGFAVSLVFIGLFFFGPSRPDFGEIRDAFREANYALAFASLPVYFLGIWLRTIRWQYLLRPVVKTSTRRLYPVVIIGLTANNLIPARIGELVRAYILGEREKVSKAASLGTIAVDRLFDGLTLIPMLVIIAALVGGRERFDVDLIVAEFTVNFVGIAVIMTVLFGLAFAVLGLLVFSTATRDIAIRLGDAVTPERFRHGLEDTLRSFFQGLDSLRSPIDLAVAWVMSTGSWVLEGLMYYMVGLAFGIDVGFHIFLLATAAANLAISILASQGGVGPFEVVTKQTFVTAGAGSSTAAAYAIGLHALVLLPVIALGLYFLWTMDLSLGDMFHRATGGDAPETAAAALPGKEAQGG